MRLSPEVVFHKFKDENTYNEITLDYDIKYDTFWDSEKYFMCKDFIKTYPYLRKPYIRRSAGNHVHIKFELNKYISTLELILLRTILLDDSKRLKSDMFRIYNGTDINILFDKKYSRGKLKYASEWMELK